MKQKIYLAGGFKSDWAANLESRVKGFDYINPKKKEFSNGERITTTPAEFVKWDLHFINKCDILFAYVERTNPSCIGLACEIGYAKGLGKTVITVIEPNHEKIKDSYLSFIGVVSDIVFKEYEEGINYLKSFII
jgi:nucleoside 2-deoxyribosyltransferase